MTASQCEFDWHIDMLSTSCEVDRHIRMLSFCESWVWSWVRHAHHHWSRVGMHALWHVWYARSLTRVTRRSVWHTHTQLMLSSWLEESTWVSWTCTSTCYHHLVISTDTSTYYHHLASSTDRYVSAISWCCHARSLTLNQKSKLTVGCSRVLIDVLVVCYHTAFMFIAQATTVILPFSSG